MYINKPLIKVEKVRVPSKVTTQMPSGQKKKPPKVVSISWTLFDNFKISKATGRNY